MNSSSLITASIFKTAWQLGCYFSRVWRYAEASLLVLCFAGHSPERRPGRRARRPLRAQFPAQPAIAGVHTGTKSLLVCDLAEQPVKVLPLVDIESGASSVIMLACNTPNVFSCGPAGCCEVQRVGPPVRSVLAAFDQASFLEFIQECNELARQDRQPAAQLLLTEPRGYSDQPENPRVRTEQAQGFQSFTKLTRGVCTYLRQQERGSPSTFRLCTRFLVALRGHNCMLQ